MANSPPINIEVQGIETELTLTASPQWGNSPLPVGMAGYLQQKGTVNGINGKTVWLVVNGERVDSTTTRNDPGDSPGWYALNRTFYRGSYTIYTVFDGDGDYVGCEGAAGTITSDGQPPEDQTALVAVAILTVLTLLGVGYAAYRLTT